MDIDALVGDTALYYARRGAFVVAVEPLPSNYEVMLRNLRVLKVDCKGCEFELMGDDSLGLFDIVKVEYSGYLINKTYHELMSSALKYGLDKHGIMT